MAKLSTDELLDAFKEMTLVELSEFVKQFEDTFEVTAAAPVAVAAAGAPAAGGDAGAAAEQDEFDVVLEEAGDKTAKDFLSGSGLEEGWRPQLEELALERARAFVATDAFEGWLTELCASSTS